MIHVVGIGLDGAVGLAPTALTLVEQASLLVGSDRHLSYFPHHPAPKHPLGDLSSAIATLKTFLDHPANPTANQTANQTANPTAVVLTSGDPLFFGLGRLLLEQLPADFLQFHPHLSSIQLAFSAIKQPWQDAVIVSVHGRSLDALIPALKRSPAKLAILTDPTHSPRAIAALIISLELPVDYRCHICENLGGSHEAVHTGAVQEFLTRDFASLSVMVLVKVDVPTDLRTLPLFGIADGAFATFGDRPGLMTKREVRMLVLGELALPSGHSGPVPVIWDIGAGTGSVSIELGRLCPSAQVFAIEKTAAGVGLIEANGDRFKVTNVQPIRGSAPAALAELPDPDRVFIGGSGGNLEAILAVCGARLRAEGVVVLALATLENLAIAQAWFKREGWTVRLMQAQFSKGTAIANHTRWSPLNPIHIITATQHGSSST